MSQFCVVLFTGRNCDECPLVTCVMEVKGPFGSRNEAIDEARKYPDWTTPHIMPLVKGDEWTAANYDGHIVPRRNE